MVRTMDRRSLSDRSIEIRCRVAGRQARVSTRGVDMSRLRVATSLRAAIVCAAEAIGGGARKRTRTAPTSARGCANLRRRSLAIMALYAWVFGAVAAQAHQSPATCNGNGVVLNLSRSPASVLVGGTVTYHVSIGNLDDPSIGLVACDVTDV